MVLNYIWIAFFLISLAVGFIKLIFFHDTEVFTIWSTARSRWPASVSKSVSA